MTEEQAAAYVAALVAEKEGYKARLAAVGKGYTHDRLTADQLKGRVGEVDAEVKRVKAEVAEGKKETADA